MFEFAWPWMGLLLFVPFFVRYLLRPSSRQEDNIILRFPHLEIIRESFGGSRVQETMPSLWFLLMLSLLWLCMVLALMRPQNIDKMQEIQNEGYDIMLAVDLSGSMRALDFTRNFRQVSRLEVAKEVVGSFVKERKYDRIGLILFGDFAYQYAPLTLDRDSVVAMLNDTVTSMAGEGTAIGDAIGLAVKALRKRPEKSRILILLTDGEDTASSIPPLEAAKLAKKYGIKIYTIGIGSDGLVPFPDQYGRVSMARMRLDEDLLRKIAQTTGGSFYQATDMNALIKVYDKINAMEKTKAETMQYIVRTPLFRYPLGAALFLLLLIALFPLISVNNAKTVKENSNVR